MARRENGQKGREPEHTPCRCPQCAALLREIPGARKDVREGLEIRAEQVAGLRALLKEQTKRADDAEASLAEAEWLLDDVGLGGMLGGRLTGLDAIKAVFAEHQPRLYPHELAELARLTSGQLSRCH